MKDTGLVSKLTVISGSRGSLDITQPRVLAQLVESHTDTLQYIYNQQRCQLTMDIFGSPTDFQWGSGNIQSNLNRCETVWKHSFRALHSQNTWSEMMVWQRQYISVDAITYVDSKCNDVLIIRGKQYFQTWNIILAFYFEQATAYTSDEEDNKLLHHLRWGVHPHLINPPTHVEASSSWEYSNL